MNCQLLNENSLILYLGADIDPQVALRVRHTVDLIRARLADQVCDLIPSYNSIHITFDLTRTDWLRFKAALRALLTEAEQAESSCAETSVIEIPVYYGPEVALDMDDFCRHSGLSRDEVIALHAGTEYSVYAIGFSPGFAYLGNVDSRIALPRKQTPRTRVPAGSLGIADTQTAIYPSDSPGGWNILGRTPLNLVDFARPSLTPMNTGDRVRFVPVSRDEFEQLGGVF